MSAGSSKAAKKWLTWLLAGLLFVSQIASAAKSCMLSMAAGFPESSAQAMQDEGCDSMPMDAAVCKLRCLSQDQSAASPDQPLHAVIASAPAERMPPELPAAQCPSQLRSLTPLPGGPPLRILHCSYQI